MTEAGAPRPPGLAGSLARLARTALGVLRTRLEIRPGQIVRTGYTVTYEF